MGPNKIYKSYHSKRNYKQNEKKTQQNQRKYFQRK